MVIIINGQEITCESYLKESNKLVLINAQIETEAGIETANMELNGVNWSSVTLPVEELPQLPTIEERLEILEDVIFEISFGV